MKIHGQSHVPRKYNVLQKNRISTLFSSLTTEKRTPLHDIFDFTIPINT